jgi:serine phosphatase RsbU (regulator of sigma subunit)/DNA-binding response OmpR family regulator/anti-sigma regulatory factor (Ser/Thr protein kinase)
LSAGAITDLAAGAAPEEADALDRRPAILLVDDNRDNLIALEAVLEPLGEGMLSVQSGEQALRALLREDFAVILLDVRMAGMDGLETARIIRSRPRTRHIPIIFLTARASDVEDIALAYATGAVDYVVKPFEPDMLRAKVSVFVELSRERAERVRQSRARAQAEAVAATVRKLQVVSDAALAHLELDQLLAETLERACGLFDADAGGVLLCEEGDRALQLRASLGEAVPLATGERIAVGEGPIGRVASDRRPVLLGAADFPPASPEHPPAIDSVLVVPLIGPGRLIGLLYLGRRSGRLYAAADLELLALAAERMAMAIDHAQRFAHGLELVEVLQRRLLPERLPAHHRVALAARYLPSGLAALVGGDWYDALVLDDERLGVMIGDIVGHGVQAATTMGELRNALRAFAIEGHAPGGALTLLNRVVHTTLGPGMVATVLFLIVDPAAHQVTIASAGHPPPARLRADGRVDYLDVDPCLPLGVDARAAISERVHEIAAGDTLLVYTDGLIERREESIEVGLKRLLDALRDAPGGVEALCEHVLERTLGSHLGQDDAALLAVRLLELPAAPLELTLPASADSVRIARHRLREWIARGGGVEPTVAQDLELACGEACNNAVVHADGTTFSVRAERVHGTIVMEITDDGSWRERRGETGGWGLLVMDNVCDTVEVDRASDGTHVRMRRAVLGAGAVVTA